MSIQIPFDNSFARLPEGFAAHVTPEPVAAPQMIAFNHSLAQELRIDVGDESALANVFSGNVVPEGASPLAQLYAGHQFGHFNPQLGDGRAHLLGEISTPSGRFDIQLKGSGRTPFSRSGDGRAWLGPVLREYVISEAMHALGIPTTRALAAVSTGEKVLRESVLPGAVLTRVAASHLRVGHFQVFAARQQYDHLRQLFDYAVARHDPSAQTPLAFLQGVISRQASLVAGWMAVGFIHGVMNTDNCTVSGETIDYGPCAFMDRYDPATVFSSIDQFGRYAYSNQPDIIVWNMAQLATALVPLVEDADTAIADFTAAVNAMPDMIRTAWRAAFGRKIGIAEATEEDAHLITDLLALMSEGHADFTNFFRALSNGTAKDHILPGPDFQSWERAWHKRLDREAQSAARMQAANPVLIPRNHRIEQMIDAAVAGDHAPFQRLMSALAAPFEDNPAYSDLAAAPTPDEIVPATFCGT